MMTCCIKCRKDNDNIDSKIFRTKNYRLLISHNIKLKFKILPTL